ncbi:Protein CBG26501 [Caenorhabditis briggsae]|uniref:Protein CBG26501 n=1 Tax=Caenorhabditis briggsae TaxID=6238 RepID=B6ILB8_CAEBR|nr:Protein CBG26501 [Caenorhabditis briggsae]CAS00698.1 Protein CBG26501 [Caenorhabditis briggsae]
MNVFTNRREKKNLLDLLGIVKSKGTIRCHPVSRIYFIRRIVKTLEKLKFLGDEKSLNDYVLFFQGS